MSAPDELRHRIIDALRTVVDPEIPVNIYDLGLIYEMSVDEDGRAAIRMTLTTPNCPVADAMPQRVREAVLTVEGVEEATVELTWDPPWGREMMSDDARLTLEMMGIDWSDPRKSRGQHITPLTLGRTADSRNRPRTG